MLTIVIFFYWNLNSFSVKQDCAELSSTKVDKTQCLPCTAQRLAEKVHKWDSLSSLPKLGFGAICKYTNIYIYICIYEKSYYRMWLIQLWRTRRLQLPATNPHVVWRYLVDMIKVYSQVVLGKKCYSSYGTKLDSISWNTRRKGEVLPCHPMVKTSNARRCRFNLWSGG